MGFRSTPIDEFRCQPFYMIGRQLMLITAQKPQGAVNTMTAGWGGLGVMWGVPVCFAVIRPQRYTKEFVDATDRFSLCFFDSSYAKVMRYMGTVSGRDEDKITRSGLTCIFEDNTPMFAEAQTAILATKLYAQDMTEDSFLNIETPLQWYPEKDYHTLYIGRVDRVLERT